MLHEILQWAGWSCLALGAIIFLVDLIDTHRKRRRKRRGGYII